MSCLPTCRKVNKGANLTYARTCYFLRLPTYRKLKKVGFTICLCLASLCHVRLLIARRRSRRSYVMSFFSRNANTGGGFDICLYVPWCTSTYRKVKTGWFSHRCVPGFPLVMSSYLSKGEMSFYLSKGEKGLALSHACTRLCVWHAFLLIAK